MNGCDDETTAFSLRLIDDWGSHRRLGLWHSRTCTKLLLIVLDSNCMLKPLLTLSRARIGFLQEYVLSLAYALCVCRAGVVFYNVPQSAHTQPLRNASEAVHIERHGTCGAVGWFMTMACIRASINRVWLVIFDIFLTVRSFLGLIRYVTCRVHM